MAHLTTFLASRDSVGICSCLKRIGKGLDELFAKKGNPERLDPIYKYLDVMAKATTSQHQKGYLQEILNLRAQGWK